MGSEVFVNADREAAARSEGEHDSELVQAAQQGAIEAFDVLVDHYYPQVYGIACHMCGVQAAEDITQDVFLQAWTALQQFQYRGEASFKTWLLRIAVNTSINRLRKRRRRQQIAGLSLDEPVETESGTVGREVADRTYEPYRMVQRKELQRAVHQVIGRLKPKYQAVLVLVDLEGMEYQQAADVLDCPLGTLKSRLVRARDAFADEFRRYMHGNVDWAEVLNEVSGSR